MEDARAASATIPTLTRKGKTYNWNSWKAIVKCEPFAKDGWEAVLVFDDSPGMTPSTAELRRRSKVNLAALSLIFRTVSDEIIGDIADLEVAKTAWETLETICCDNTELGAAQKLRELATMTTTSEIHMLEYCNKMADMNKLLTKNELGITDKQLAALCLTGLPSDYTLVATRENMSMATVKRILMEEEEQMNSRKKEPSFESSEEPKQQQEMEQESTNGNL